MLIVSYGGGVNSKAMLLEWRNRNMPRPDLILFADTGGERPETYTEVAAFSEWLVGAGYPPITTVRNDGKHGTLEQECLTQKTLPSLAYGWKKCSEKYKHRPQNKCAAAHPAAQQIWKSGAKVTKLIGIDAGESHRKKIESDDKYNYRYPLVEWDMDRDDCVHVIKAVGLPVPPKSACFFCPASRKQEILELAATHPDLTARAIAIEQNAAAGLQTVKGLGRRFAWGQFLADSKVTLPVLSPDDDTPIDTSCMCYDG